jgi:hypothetical protein
MVSWPAEGDAGLMISDRAHWGEFPAKVRPSDLIDVDEYRQQDRVMAPFELRRFTSYPFVDVDRGGIAKGDPSYPVNFLLTRRLAGAFVRDNSYGEMAQKVLSRHDVDVAAIYFQGADHVSHGFWKFFEPEPFREAGWKLDVREVQQLENVIPRYYVHLDHLLDAFLRLLDDDAFVLLLSDHGFGPGLGKYEVKSGDYISGNHRFEALLILSGPAIREDAPQIRQITHFDVLPTMLAYLGLPVARDLPGEPLLEYFEEGFLDPSSLRFVESYGDGPGRAAGARRSQHDEEILEELRSLGYIE